MVTKRISKGYNKDIHDALFLVKEVLKNSIFNSDIKAEGNIVSGNTARGHDWGDLKGNLKFKLSAAEPGKTKVDIEIDATISKFGIREPPEVYGRVTKELNTIVNSLDDALRDEATPPKRP